MDLSTPSFCQANQYKSYKDLYRLVRQAEDVQQASVITDRDGNVLTREESVRGISGENNE